jgi:hypothetical protein
MDLDKGEGISGFPEAQTTESDDLGDLYNFTFLQNPPESGTLDPFAQSTTTTFAQNMLSPFDLGISSGSQGAGQLSEMDFLFDQGDFSFGDLDEFFGDMPDMPGLNGAIDQGFLEFLDTTGQ